MAFHVGQLVVCVDATQATRDGGYASTEILSFLKKRAVYRIKRITATGMLRFIGDPVDFEDGYSETCGYSPRRFRPLIDQQDDAKLIAKIKACKPARQPTHHTGNHNIQSDSFVHGVSHAAAHK